MGWWRKTIKSMIRGSTIVLSYLCLILTLVHFWFPGFLWQYFPHFDFCWPFYFLYFQSYFLFLCFTTDIVKIWVLRISFISFSVLLANDFAKFSMVFFLLFVITWIGRGDPTYSHFWAIFSWISRFCLSILFSYVWKAGQPL